MNPIRVVLERFGSSLADRGRTPGSEGATESTHVVHGVVLEGPDGSAHAFGEADLTSFWRSSMKPFQALPMVEQGLFDRLGLDERAIAVACASHHGTPAHLEVVESILAAAGVAADALACGPHRPIDEEAARELDAAGRLPERLHNNCSGKHAAMLALARARGWPEGGYHAFEHPLQVLLREELARWIDPEPPGLPWGVDGCGVPTPSLSLREMARAYARLGRSEEPAARAVVGALTRHPTLVSGASAFSAKLMRATHGRILAKEGAEGVFCLASSAAGWGAAFKVADGAMRAMGPAVLHALSRLALLEAAELRELEDARRPLIENTRGEAVARLSAERDGA